MIQLEDLFKEENVASRPATSTGILYPTKDAYERVGKILHDGIKLGKDPALQKTEERLRFVLETMPVMMDAFDEHGTVLFWNNECEKVTGFSAEEMVGNPKAMNLLYPDKSYLSKMLAELKERGFDYYDWEWQMSTKKGDVRTIAWSNVSDRYPIAGWASWAVGIDVTEGRRT